MDCKFKITKLADNKYLYECKNEGCTKGSFISTVSVKKLKRVCDSTEDPGILEKAKKFGKAYIIWEAAGFPTRSKTEIRSIFNNVCMVCGWFNHDKGICKKCFCNCKNNEAFLNKIKWATEKCPDNRW